MKLVLLILISFFGASSYAEVPYLECETLMSEGYSEKFVVGYENNLIASDKLAIGPGFAIDQDKLSRIDYPIITGPEFNVLVSDFLEWHSNGSVDRSHMFSYDYDSEKMFGVDARYVRLESSRSFLETSSLRPDLLYISESLLNGDSGQGYLITLTDTTLYGMTPMLLSSCERL